MFESKSAWKQSMPERHAMLARLIWLWSAKRHSCMTYEATAKWGTCSLATWVRSHGWCRYHWPMHSLNLVNWQARIHRYITWDRGQCNWDCWPDIAYFVDEECSIIVLQCSAFSAGSLSACTTSPPQKEQFRPHFIAFESGWLPTKLQFFLLRFAAMPTSYVHVVNCVRVMIPQP